MADGADKTETTDPVDTTAPSNPAPETQGDKQPPEQSAESGKASDVQVDPQPEDEPEPPQSVDPVEAVHSRLEAVEGRLDLIERAVEEKLHHISKKVDTELRQYLAIERGAEGRSIGERLTRLEAKLKHT